MANLDRVRVVLTGFVGGPGVSTFYFLDVATAMESLNKFYTTIAGFFPIGVTINVQRSGDTIEDTTGALTGSWVGGVTAPIAATGNALHAGPVGCMAGWETGQIMDGHRVRGRTFIVPGSSAIFGPDGALIPTAVPGMTAAGTQLILEQAASFVVWHRPRKARAATATRPAVTPHLGNHALVTTCRVPDKAVVLRSRRD